MLGDVVLVRAVRGEPVMMVAVEMGRGVVYVANPNSIARIRSGDTWPVGVPVEDVFQFNKETYAELRARWESSQRLEREDWRPFNLRLYAETSAGIAA